MQISYSYTFVKLANSEEHLMKWAIKLNAYTLTCIPLWAMKGHVLADFITQHPCIPIDDVAELGDHYVSLQPWILSFDDSWTQGGVWIRVAIIIPIGRFWWYSNPIDPEYSNNQVEYKALI